MNDGRYLNFDLLEHYFDSYSKTEQVIGRPILISLSLEDENNINSDIVCVFDESNKSLICFDNEKQIFFEYKDFAEDNSKSLYVINDDIIKTNINLIKMYQYYPYDFFSQIEKNKLKAIERNNIGKNEIDVFVRNRYREILLCVEDCSLLKLFITEEQIDIVPVSVWKISNVSDKDTHVSIDVAINDYTGEIYCLCKNEIRILRNSGEKPNVLQETKKMIAKYFNGSEETS